MQNAMRERRLYRPREFISPNEKEISHGRVSWQFHAMSFDQARGFTA
jgi:hypothetical protein